MREADELERKKKLRKKEEGREVGEREREKDRNILMREEREV